MRSQNFFVILGLQGRQEQGKCVLAELLVQKYLHGKCWHKESTAAPRSTVTWFDHAPLKIADRHLPSPSVGRDSSARWPHDSVAALMAKTLRTSGSIMLFLVLFHGRLEKSNGRLL